MHQMHMSQSEPMEQWDDRILLYNAQLNLTHILVTQDTTDVRQE